MEWVWPSLFSDREPLLSLRVSDSADGGNFTDSTERNKPDPWRTANGSRAMTLPTTGGRSYTGTFVLIDEADWTPDLKVLLNAVPMNKWCNPTVINTPM
jgi:hypothetical protein